MLILFFHKFYSCPLGSIDFSTCNYRSRNESIWFNAIYILHLQLQILHALNAKNIKCCILLIWKILGRFCQYISLQFWVGLKFHVFLYTQTLNINQGLCAIRSSKLSRSYFDKTHLAFFSKTCSLANYFL